MLSARMVSLGYENITPDYKNVTYKNYGENRSVAYVPLFKNDETGVFVQLIVMKESDTKKTVVSVMKPDADWVQFSLDYSKMYGEVSFYGSNGLYLKTMTLKNGVIVDRMKADAMSFSRISANSNQKSTITPPLKMLRNDIIAVTTQTPLYAIGFDGGLPDMCNSCHGGTVGGDPCAGRWGEFGCGELPEVIIPSYPGRPPVINPPTWPSIPFIPGGSSNPNSNYSIENKLTDPCLNNILKNALLNNYKSKLSTLLNDIFGKSNAFSIIFEQSNDLPDFENGNTTAAIFLDRDTRDTIGISFKITLNGKILPTASMEYVTRTMFHEFLHAYINYTGRWGAFKTHNEMADKYRDRLAEALRSNFPNLSEEDAQAMAWGGLDETDAWKKFQEDHPEEASEMKVIDSKYRVGETKGTKCSTTN